MESISAIIFGLLLMLPLFVQLQMLVLHPRKLLATLRCYLTESSTRDVRLGERNLVQHYPKLPDLLNSNSNFESSMMMWTSPRTVLSLPAVPRVGEHRHQFVRNTIPLARHSSSYVATQIELPVVDITCNYNSYRYSTLEENLRERYGANYPPGEVVLNYIQLNTPDSRTRLGNDDIGNDLLDLFEGNDAGTYSPVSTKLETEYLNLLDHFVLKRSGRALTAGKFTETLPLADERNVEVSSVYAGTSSQSTLRSSVAQEKESRSSSNQRSSKGIEYGQGGGANKRSNSSQREFRRQ
ncbi:uncharacterized protein [Polyergus mexicanus]|uniref:uncharacterized protein n=1 Tax=Polyergus mexicanus TaxID=615972 RepID=UPI0038B6279B